MSRFALTVSSTLDLQTKSWGRGLMLAGNAPFAVYGSESAIKVVVVVVLVIVVNNNNNTDLTLKLGSKHDRFVSVSSFVKAQDKSFIVIYLHILTFYFC